MNVALLIDTLLGGGAERVVCELAAGLARRGHGVHVYCLKQTGPPAQQLKAAGVTVREVGRAGRDPGLLWRLGRVMRQDRIDVAHAHNSAAVVWALPAARWLGVPLVQTRHGALLGQPSRCRRLAELAAPLLSRIAVVAESLGTQVRPARQAAAAVHVPNGFDRPAIPPDEARALLNRHCGRPLHGPVVLNVGTICPEKDTRGLLCAFALLRRSIPKAILVCVGGARDDQYAARVRDDCRVLQLGHDVIFTGPIADAWRLMAGADVFCLSSRTEAMPNVIVEAMSQSAPIVATAVGDVGSLGTATRRGLIQQGRNGVLVPPGNPQALAAALARVLEQPDAARRRAVQARQDYAAHYTAEAMVARYEQVYTECCQRRTRQLVRRARPRVLMVGPGPGQIGGMSSVIDTLLAGPLRDRAELFRYATPSASATTAADEDHGVFHHAAVRIWAVGRHLRALGRLAATIRRNRIDIVHVHTCSFFSFYRSLLDVAVARLLGRAVCLHIHGGRFGEFCAQSGRLGRWLRRRGCEVTDAVIVLSRQWHQTLRPYLGRARLHVVPNGVTLQASACPTDAKRPCRFLFLGLVSQSKGVAELLDAAEQLREAEVPFEVTVAGPPSSSDAENWEEIARRRGLTECARFIGPVRGRAKDELLANCDCLVLPSHGEGLPMALLEAAAAGKAVIATAVGGIPEFMTPVGQQPGAGATSYLAPLVRPRDGRGLALQMARLARDAGLRKRLGRVLRRRVQTQYSSATVAQRLSAVYQRMLGREPLRSRIGQAVEAWLVRNVTYPLHERLRGRPTLRELRVLRRLSGFTPDKLRAITDQRLRKLLTFASSHLPHYADTMTRHGVDPAASNPVTELRKVPVHTKGDIRAAGDRIVWSAVPGGLQPCSSGGTTGDTLHFHVDRQRQAQDLAARLFMQSLFGVRPGDRRVHLWGSPIESAAGRVRRWRDRLLNEVLLDAFDMSPPRMDAHLARILRFRPRVLYGYTSAVTRLAAHAAKTCDSGDFAWLRLIVLTGEEVAAWQRAQVRRAFGCPVAAEYGNREVGLIAHDCPWGRMHVLSPYTCVDVIADGQSVEVGHCGEIVCTTLTTRAQPFLRYRVGDAGRLIEEQCPCGLPLPVMRVEGGKLAGFLALPDGRLCHGAVSSHALQAIRGIVAFRTHQRALDHIEISLVVNDEFDVAAIERIRQRYHRLFGEQVRVDCRIVDEIPPDPSGKRRHVISDVAPDYARFDVVDTEAATPPT